MLMIVFVFFTLVGFYEPKSLDCDIHDEEYMRQLEEFDKNYPYMEKKVLPGQWR